MRLEPHIPTSIDRYRRAVHRLGRRIGPATKVICLEDAIRSAAPRLRNSRSPFGLPHSLLKASGITLPLLDFPPGAIDLSMRDWIKAGDYTCMSIDDFLGYGDWSPILRLHWKKTVLKEARQLKKARLRYQEIPAYQRLCLLAESGEACTRQCVKLNTVKRINTYFERFVALFRSIERDGLWREASEGDRHISIAITASGEFARLKGAQHRTAIALALGIATVPMELRMIHLDAWTAAGSVDECLRRATAKLVKSPDGLPHLSE